MFPPDSMLDALETVKSDLLNLLCCEQWSSLCVDYHPPIVHRLFLQVSPQFRVYLHRILPCTREQALLHPHPWPSAVELLDGGYEMGVGYGAGTDRPPVATRMFLATGSTYEMTDPDAWHYVRPIHSLSYSIMLTGQPWTRPFDIKPESPLQPLSAKMREDMILRFKEYAMRMR